MITGMELKVLLMKSEILGIENSRKLITVKFIVNIIMLLLDLYPEFTCFGFNCYK